MVSTQLIRTSSPILGGHGDDGTGHDLMGAHVTFSCSMPQEMAHAVGWRGAADVAMLERVHSGSIDADQTLRSVRTWLGCARLREDDRTRCTPWS